MISDVFRTQLNTSTVLLFCKHSGFSQKSSIVDVRPGSKYVSNNSWFELQQTTSCSNATFRRLERTWVCSYGWHWTTYMGVFLRLTLNNVHGCVLTVDIEQRIWVCSYGWHWTTYMGVSLRLTLNRYLPPRFNVCCCHVQTLQYKYKNVLNNS